jgi:hypothetical protein
MVNLSKEICFVHTSEFRKIWRNEAHGVTSPHKEVVLRIFMALKNPFPWLGLNPRTLEPVSSTLTITPPMRWPSSYFFPSYSTDCVFKPRVCRGISVGFPSAQTISANHYLNKWNTFISVINLLTANTNTWILKNTFAPKQLQVHAADRTANIHDSHSCILMRKKFILLDVARYLLEKKYTSQLKLTL